MKPENQMLRNLHRVPRFFVGFLGVLSALLAAHYPLLPDHVIAVYRDDAKDARMLATAITMIGFAAITSVVSIPSTKLLRICRKKLSAKRFLAWSSAMLLTVCLLGLVSSYVLVRVSTRIANAFLTAEARAPVDRIARDFLAEASDISTNVVRRYRLSAEYIDLEQISERSPQEVLSSVDHGPLQGAIAAVDVCVTTIVCTGCCW